MPLHECIGYLVFCRVGCSHAHPLHQRIDSVILVAALPRWAFRGSTRNGTMETLTPAALTYDAGLPTYLATSSCRSDSNHVGCLVTAYHHASVTSDFRTSPCMSRLVAALRRIEFVILRTDTSP